MIERPGSGLSSLEGGSLASDKPISVARLLAGARLQSAREAASEDGPAVPGRVTRAAQYTRTVARPAQAAPGLLGPGCARVSCLAALR